jgi:hypothetical protein
MSALPGGPGSCEPRTTDMELNTGKRAKAIQRNNCYDFDGCRGLIV